jgi:hypothetical protein
MTAWQLVLAILVGLAVAVPVCVGLDWYYRRAVFANGTQLRPAGVWFLAFPASFMLGFGGVYSLCRPGPPEIGSLAADPPEVRQGHFVRLTLHGVKYDATPRVFDFGDRYGPPRAEFFAILAAEPNGDDPDAGRLLLGKDDDGSNGWSLDVPPHVLHVGSNTMLVEFHAHGRLADATTEVVVRAGPEDGQLGGRRGVPPLTPKP